MEHTFHIRNTWTGNTGSGTSSYRSYSRNHELSGKGKHQPIPGSSDAAFRGDGSRYNPEELLVASLAACHMLWMLHLCADAGIVVTAYTDDASGRMRSHADGSGEFVEVELRPQITITESACIPEAERLNERAHHLCFISRSVNFPVRVVPTVHVAS
jgi:organic hydroperoxide reductase OsmC/OhrA